MIQSTTVNDYLSIRKTAGKIQFKVYQPKNQYIYSNKDALFERIESFYGKYASSSESLAENLIKERESEK